MRCLGKPCGRCERCRAMQDYEKGRQMVRDAVVKAMPDNPRDKDEGATTQ